MKALYFFISTLVILLLQVQGGFAQSNDAYLHHIMAGLSNKGQHKDKPYLTAGDRTYIVGTQDGDFPDLGGHVPGEMGGVWMQPIKLLDGFWLKLSGEKSKVWLNDARE